VASAMAARFTIICPRGPGCVISRPSCTRRRIVDSEMPLCRAASATVTNRPSSDACRRALCVSSSSARCDVTVVLATWSSMRLCVGDCSRRCCLLVYETRQERKPTRGLRVCQSNRDDLGQ
jgi:hypothetical protein